MATATPARFYLGQPGVAESTIFTATTLVIVKEIILANTSGTAQTFDLSVVPTGQVAGVANRIVPTLMLNAGELAVLDISVVLNTGDFLSAKASAAGSVTATICGVTVA